MDKNDIDLIVQQLRYILTNREINEDMIVKSAEFSELQDGMFFLAESVKESRDFLMSLTDSGKINTDELSGRNIFSEPLKELHSNIKHLTWQANQVAIGDYNQSTKFLGEFSHAFNQMVEQLAYRDIMMKEQSILLSESVELLKSIMDGLNDWIIVTSAITGEIIYVNESANEKFFKNIEKHSCENNCELFAKLKSYTYEQGESIFFEHCCNATENTYLAKSYNIKWNDNPAFVHYITDVTDEKEYKLQMEKLAYKDELTEVYNRRFCIGTMEKLLSQNKSFVFCIADMDGLKYVNDNFGHNNGDLYIKTVINEINKKFGADDIVCRFGGDEFTVISLNKSREDVKKLFSEINKSLKELEIEYPMAISAGAIYIKEDTKCKYKEIIAKADRLMYEDKRIRKSIK